MRILFALVFILLNTIRAEEPKINLPQKFATIEIDGYTHVFRSANGQYGSFAELPTSVKNEFLHLPATHSRMKSRIAKAWKPTTTFVVTSSADDADADLTDNIYFPQTLRSAIQNANKLGGSQAISFAPGITTIQPISQLPSVTVELIIDGTVSAGKVILNGSATAAQVGLSLTKTSGVTDMIFKSWKNIGLALTSGAVSSVVQRCEFTLNLIGLNINADSTFIGSDIPEDRNLAYGNTQDGIDLVYADHNIIINNFCGTKDGTTASPNTYNGVYVLGEWNWVENNVLSGNLSSGLEIGEFSKQTLVDSNMIGVDVTGKKKLSNTYEGINTFADNDSIIDNLISGNGWGITVSGQASQTYIARNTIGLNYSQDSLLGNQSGLQILGEKVVIDENIISGNTSTGIKITGWGGTIVKRNFIGTDGAGKVKFGNGGAGINILCNNNIIGGPNQADINIISGNGGGGIEMFGSYTISFPGGSKPNYVRGNIIQNNFVGTDVTGLIGIPNYSGISMQGNIDSNFVRKNIISGNQHYGIWMQPFGGSPTRNVFTNNFIGSDVNGYTALPNRDRGIYILAGSDNLFGGSTFIDKNLISGNIGQGILISGPSSGNTIKYNIIGTDWTGSFSLPNTTDGVLIDQSASNNVIQRNLISGNGRDGVTIETNSNLTPNGNIVIANTIGLDLSNTLALPNKDNGVLINNARNTRIGGSELDSSNIISGNIGNGIYVYGNISNGNMIRGNYIGTDYLGDKAIPNYRGILISYANGNIVGGSETGSGNLLSGNTYGGIYLYSSDSNMVYNNVVGLDILQSKIIANGDNGIAVDSADYNIIGGDQIGTGNTVSGNKLAGIALVNTATENKVFNNIIGTDVTLNKKFGNIEDGIQILYGANRSTIGKPGVGNIIKFNTLAGILVADSNQNKISANSIYDNGELGIDLYSGFTGVTPNDVLDADDGANNLQNFPILTFADGPLPFRVMGKLNSKPNETYTVEIFGAGVSDSTKFGEGKDYIGSATVTTDSLGNGIFSVWFSKSISSGTFITATTTDTMGNTSEFSKCIEVTASSVSADIAVTAAANADTLHKADTLAYLITLQNNGPDSAKQVVLKDTLSKHLTFVADSLSKGTAQFSNGILTVTVGLMKPGEKVKIVLVTKIDSTGPILNKVYASALGSDFDLSNNIAVDTVIVAIVLSAGTETNEIPKTFMLHQNYPNPFNPVTTITFAIPHQSLVTIKLFDILGREVAMVLNEEKKEGIYSVPFNGSKLSSGVYFYRMQADNFMQTKKFLLQK